MRVLVTMPGKYGDCWWSLPTARAISEAAGEPVDFLVSPKYSSHIELLKLQPYLGQVSVWPAWQIQEGAPLSPWSPFDDTLHHEPHLLTFLEPYDYIVHLGYRAWPDRPLPQCIYEQTKREYPELPIADLDLEQPWIRPPYQLPAAGICLGFTDEHFELKYGLYRLLLSTTLVEARRVRCETYGTERSTSGQPYQLVNVSTSPRWQHEAGLSGYDWGAAAVWMGTSTLFVGCCSALHVLACAMGTPVVILEPSEARWNDVFYPYGKTGPQVTLVTGNDGRPTFDSRHLINTIQTKLRASGVIND